MNILIADDHALLRAGLRQILEDAYPQATFTEAGTTGEALERLAQHPCDIVLLDIFMPGRSGLEVLREIRQTRPDTPVLVVSSAPEEQLALRVLRAGARGYLNKRAAPEELVTAIARLQAGRKYVNGFVAEELAAEVTRADRPAGGRLSDREFAVLQLIAAGKSIKEIAFEFSLSTKTVSTFRSRIRRKLGVSNDVEIVRYALEHGLAGPRPPVL